MGKHSSSICEHDGEIYLAYYQGEKEDWDQHVIVLKQVEGEWLTFKEFQHGSGNPVIFSWQGHLYIAMTQFREETKGIENCHVLWANTDLHIYQFNHVGSTVFEIAEYPYCACRIAPFEYQEKLLLPCYDESRGEGLILEMDKMFGKPVHEEGGNKSLVRHSIVQSNKTQVIQPTLFKDKHNSLMMLARNFGYGRYHRKSGVILGVNTTSRNWMCKLITEIPNWNDSILAIPRKDIYWMVYSEECYRKKLILRNESGTSKRILTKDHGSYPNYCVTKEGNIKICFTEYADRMVPFINREIMVITFSSKMKKLEEENISEPAYPYLGM